MNTITATARELHLLDIENLLGGSHFTARDVAQFREFYISHNAVAADAHIVIATSSQEGIIEAALGWPGARALFQLGHDGADLALLAVIEDEHVAERFDRVVIASGDGIFANSAESLYTEGLDVAVFARALSVSTHFEHAAEIVHLFSPIDFDLAA